MIPVHFQMVEYKCPGYQHGPFVDLLSATGNFAGEQVLAACSESREIKMLLTASGYINVAYQNSDDDVTLRFICEGEQGNLFAYSSEDPGVIVGLSTTLPFKVLSDDMYFPGQEVKEGIFYLGKPQEALISLGEKIMARDLKGKDLWAVEGEVEGKTINPKGIAFSRQHQVLLVADGTNGRLLVLHPETGEVLQTVPLPEDLGVIYSVRVRKSDDGDDLVVYSKGSDNTLSWFSFQ